MESSTFSTRVTEVACDLEHAVASAGVLARALIVQRVTDEPNDDVGHSIEDVICELEAELTISLRDIRWNVTTFDLAVAAQDFIDAHVRPDVNDMYEKVVTNLRMRQGLRRP